MPQEQTISLPRGTRAAELRPESFNPDDNTIEVCWTTGATVQRYSWIDGPYLEELVVDEASVRLDRLNAGASFLNTHGTWDLDDVIGAVVPGSARIENGKGLARIQLSNAPADADIVQKIRDGIIRNISVGYVRLKIQKTETADGALPLWRVVDWEPTEISAVPVPADAGAQVRAEPQAHHPCTIVRSDDPSSTAAPAANTGETPMPNGAPTAQVPAAPETARNQQPAPAAGTQPAATPAAAAAPDQGAIDQAARSAADAAIVAERSRVADIMAMADQFGERALAQEHAGKATSVEEFRRVLMDKLATRSDAGGPRNATVQMGVTDAEKRGAAIQDALVHRYDPSQPLSEAGREFRGMSLLEMGRDYLEARGVRTRGMSKNELAGAMLARRVEGDEIFVRGAGGMLSTSDFPNILANVANKTLRMGYDAAPQTFRPLVRVVTVPDFKQVSRTQLGEAPQLEKVNEHGEFKRGKMGEAAEKYAISTYGKIVAITRQVIINDDLQAFTRIPRAFGVAAANLESDLVWGIITANAAMGDGTALFHANHKNLGTGAAIDVASVGAGRTAMRKQVGIDGKTLLNITPAFLIGPTALQTLIEQFLTAITPAQVSNVVPEGLRKLTPITEPRLDAASASNWYLAGDPNQIDTIELAYLEGQEGLFTETRTGFDVDGVEVKVRQDVGAKAIDWRGFYKNPN